MKKLRKLSALFLVACLLLTVVLPVAAADAEAKELELRCVSDHPGVYGYDVTYTFNALYGTEMDKDYLEEDAFELYCAEPAIIIEGNTVTVPASFKDNTDVDGIKIYAKYEDAVTYYPLMIKNFWKTWKPFWIPSKRQNPRRPKVNTSAASPLPQPWDPASKSIRPESKFFTLCR